VKDESERAPTEKERWRRLMMAAVDGEISAEDRATLDRALARDPGLRREWNAFERLKEVTSAMTPGRPPPEIWDTYWEDVYRRIERGLGWILVSVSAIVLAVWGAWTWVGELLADSTLPPVIRWSVLALAAGLAILFVSVVRERWFLYRDDPYKDVVR
jgi:ferric-dicitrate binding protein FerR (iron transport regulator)